MLVFRASHRDSRQAIRRVSYTDFAHKKEESQILKTLVFDHIEPRHQPHHWEPESPDYRGSQSIRSAGRERPRTLQQSTGGDGIINPRKGPGWFTNPAETSRASPLPEQGVNPSLSNPDAEEGEVTPSDAEILDSIVRALFGTIEENRTGNNFHPRWSLWPASVPFNCSSVC